MLFAAMMIDRPAGQVLRERTAAAHRTFVTVHSDRIVLGGPLLSDDGARNIGSLMVLSAESADEVQSFLSEEPYNRAGLFEQVIVRPFRLVMQNPTLTKEPQDD